jgi:hypothetical protein
MREPLYNFGSPSNQIEIARMQNQETVALYVDKFCREKPLALFIGAAFELVKDLAPGPYRIPPIRKYPSGKAPRR